MVMHEFQQRNRTSSDKQGGIAVSKCGEFNSVGSQKEHHRSI